MSIPNQTCPESRTAADLLVDPPWLVTQSMLARYERLYHIEGERRSLRRRILQLLDEGAPIERGERTLDLRNVEARNFSREKLTAVLGEERVEELLELIEPTILRYLSVRKVQSMIRPDGTPMSLAEIAVAIQDG